MVFQMITDYENSHKEKPFQNLGPERACIFSEALCAVLKPESKHNIRCETAGREHSKQFRAAETGFNPEFENPHI